MSALNYFSTLIALILFSSCSKKPESCFNPSKSEGLINEEIKFTNCSKNASKYIWAFGEKSASSREENPSYAFTKPGEYTVTLTAFDQKEQKQSVSQQLIKIRQAPDADLIFWRQSYEPPFTTERISVVIINNPQGYEFSGEITGINPAEPDCGSTEGANFTFPAGEYHYQITNQDSNLYKKEGSVIITAGLCNSVKI